MLRNILFASMVAAVVVGSHSASAIVTETTLLNFDGSNGKYPQAGLTIDGSGNLFGVTTQGGVNNSGVLFELAAGSRAFSLLSPFPINNVLNPPSVGASRVVLDPAGNIYGTTNYGGTGTYGTVFKWNATSGLTTLASFTGPNGEIPPFGDGLLLDPSSATLYGATTIGINGGVGTIFSLSTSGSSMRTLAVFNGTNGRQPMGGLTKDNSGNLYGMTEYGGPSDMGTVFKIDAITHAITDLASFDGTNGSYPEGGLVIDGAGNLYGATRTNVFKVSTSTGVMSSIATLPFNGPWGSILLDAGGNIYGEDDNIIYRIDAVTGSFSTVYTLSSSVSGSFADSTLVADKQGNLYATATFGGSNNLGTVFELSGTGFLPTPEPGSAAMMGTATCLLLYRRRKSRPNFFLMARGNK